MTLRRAGGCRVISDRRPRNGLSAQIWPGHAATLARPRLRCRHASAVAGHDPHRKCSWRPYQLAGVGAIARFPLSRPGNVHQGCGHQRVNGRILWTEVRGSEDRSAAVHRTVVCGTVWAAGALKVFSDIRSGRTMEQPGLEALLAYGREGDTLAVMRLDRRSRYSRSAASPCSAWRKGSTPTRPSANWCSTSSGQLRISNGG